MSTAQTHSERNAPMTHDAGPYIEDGSRHRATPEEMIGVGLILTMTAILFVQVIARFVFNSPLSWSEELSRYLFIWLVYLLLGAVTLRGEHIVIDMLTRLLPTKLERIFHTAALVIALIINIVVLWRAADIAWIILDLGQTSAAMGLPMGLVYAALPVGLAIASVRTIQALVRVWRAPSHEHRPEKGEER